jgi:signal transduction histidine kinase
VPLEHRESVFERFHQIGDHLTAKPPGAGLGLPICRGFIDGMGGSIWCEESDFGGARFRFVLPAVDAEPAAAAGKREPAAAAQEPVAARSMAGA